MRNKKQRRLKKTMKAGAEWWIERARKHSSKDLAKAMREKYLKELDELRQKPKFESRDLVRIRELRRVLVVLNGVN